MDLRRSVIVKQFGGYDGISFLETEMESSHSVVVKRFGGYDCLYVQDVKLNPLRSDEVEVEVEYAGMNFADIYTRKGLIPKEVPFILGIECCGKVVNIGSDVTDFKVGQKVVCYDFNGGMYSERIRKSTHHCFPLPDDISCQEGAALFVNYLTAYISVITMGNLKPKESILILSCTGGVGTAAVQLARTIGDIKIVGTGSKHKGVHAKINGVDIFYSNDVIQDHIDIGKFDLILSNQSGDVFQYLQTLLNPLGRIISLGANNIIYNEHKLNLWSLMNLWWKTKDVCVTDLVMHNRTISGLHLGLLAINDKPKILQIWERICELHREKTIQVIIHAVVPMSNVVEATKILAERKNVGKVLLAVKE